MKRSSVNLAITLQLVLFIFTCPLGVDAQDLSNWADLISFRPSLEAQRIVEGKGASWRVHRIEDGYGDINLDYYPIVIKRLPKQFATPEGLLNYIRQNINLFVDTGVSKFSPLPSEQARWGSSEPLNAIVHIDMKLPGWVPVPSNPDDGSVIVSKFTKQSWTFSTIRTSYDLAHPVSGNREFGFVRRPDGSYIFYARGADRITRRLDRVGSPAVFGSGHKLWLSFQQKIARFVEDNGGEAVAGSTVSNRYNWEEVRNRYHKPTTEWLADSKGKSTTQASASASQTDAGIKAGESTTALPSSITVTFYHPHRPAWQERESNGEVYTHPAHNIGWDWNTKRHQESMDFLKADDVRLRWRGPYYTSHSVSITVPLCDRESKRYCIDYDTMLTCPVCGYRAEASEYLFNAGGKPYYER